MPHLGDDATAGGRRHRLCRKGHSQQLHHPQRVLHTVQTVFVPSWNHQGVERAPARGKRSQHPRHICVSGLLKRRQPLFFHADPPQ